MEQQKKTERRKKELEDRWREGEEIESVEYSEAGSKANEAKSYRSYKSYKSYKSYGSRSDKNGYSIDSDILSNRKIDKLKKMVMDIEKKRKNNIIIKRVVTEEKDFKKMGKKFYKKKEVEVDIISCRNSGKVLVAKLGDWQMKRKVMANKNKLKEGRIFIENDLTWQKIKMQEKIHKWAKEEREKGKEIKIGYARVGIGDTWRKWDEIERELEINTKEKKDRRDEEKENRGDVV